MFFKRQKEQDFDNVIIVGAGQVGFHIAKRLAQEGKNVTVIDRDKLRLESVTKSMDVQIIQGNGADPSILKKAAIEETHFFLAVTDSDESNLMACLFAHSLAPNAVKLARVRNRVYMEYPDIFGKSRTGIRLMVNPEQEVVHTIDRLLSLPGSIDYAQFANGRVQMVGYKMEQGILINTKLYAFREIVGDQNIMVAGIVRNKIFFTPSGSDIIKLGDVVYFVFIAESQKALLDAVGRIKGHFHSVCIAGGGEVGLSLAKLFEKRGLEVKLIEKDYARCQVLADILDTTLILNGDATDTNLLAEENVGKMDVFAAVTGDDENNILSCLLAKSLGVGDTVTKVNKSAYLSILDQIGIDHTVSSCVAAGNRFINYLRRGNVLVSASLGADSAEALEAVLPEGSPLLGQPLKTIDLPGKVLLLAVTRGNEVFIPNGETILDPEDHIILLGVYKDIHAVEPLLCKVH